MTFKNLAKKAKNRLISASATQEKVTSKALSVQSSYFINASKSRAEDDPLYSKVKKILETSPECISPIGKLIEKDLYSSLSPEEKDRYLLTLTKRFHAIKKHIQLRTSS